MTATSYLHFMTPQDKAFQKAAGKFDREKMKELIASGPVSQAVLDECLFDVVGFFGGDLDTVKILVEAGANVNGRNAKGQNLEQFGQQGVSSGLENNLLGEIIQYLKTRGYKG